MSSTGRSDVRRKDDHYVTPDWAVRRFLEAYNPPAGTWLDPGAANGELISVCRKLRPENKYLGLELRPEVEPLLKTVAIDGYQIGDFLTLASQIADKSVSSVVTNPPYSLAVPFLEQSLRIGKVVAFLLRVGFLCGGRHELTKRTRPGLFLLPNRPSFTGDGADSSEYAWFVYGDPAVAGRHFMLAETPSQEIKTWNAWARAIHLPRVSTLPSTVTGVVVP